MKDVFLNWHLGNNFGWGMLGLNLFLQWANDREVRPLMGHPITRDGLGLTDPLRLARAHRGDRAFEPTRLLAGVATAPTDARNIDAIVVDALGNGFAGSAYRGRRNVARCIFENTDLAHGGVVTRSLRRAAGRVAVERRPLAQATGRDAKIIFEGVDTSLFCPAPRSGLMDRDKFYVFSGGKVEFRKGQDLVLLAFAKFAERHRDAVLVTAWHSIWPHLSVGFKGRLGTPLGLDAHGRLGMREWAARNGVDPQSVIDVGLVPNAMMPSILREMDVALQPSRAEACTSLPVKEAMACGVPVIAAFNTGMKDLLDDDNAFVLRSQTRHRRPAMPRRCRDGERAMSTRSSRHWSSPTRTEARPRPRHALARLAARKRSHVAGARARLEAWLLSL